MSFTASTMNRVKLKLGLMFKQPLITNANLIQPAVTARSLLMNQTATADPILKGSKCVGVTAWYVDSSDIGNVSTPTDCTTPGGNVIGTLSKDYTSAPIAEAAGTARDNRCDNELAFVDEMSSVLNACFASCRNQLNAYVINQLDAESGTNIFTGLPSGWDYTTDDPNILVPLDDFQWENLGFFRLVADNNNMALPAFISGSGHFYGKWWASNYQRFNDNERGVFQAFNDQKFYFDTRQLDQEIGAAATFAVDLNSIIFWNTTFSTPTPTEKSVGSNGKKWVWVEADPELVYNNNGTLVPVMYEVEVEESCVARNSGTTELQKSYKAYVRIIGGFETAPAGPNGETGILQFRTQGA
jgi:hypothetical protein